MTTKAAVDSRKWKFEERTLIKEFGRLLSESRFPLIGFMYNSGSQIIKTQKSEEFTGGIRKITSKQNYILSFTSVTKFSTNTVCLATIWHWILMVFFLQATFKGWLNIMANAIDCKEVNQPMLIADLMRINVEYCTPLANQRSNPSTWPIPWPLPFNQLRGFKYNLIINHLYINRAYYMLY